jgi:multiple sugar transport system substrate-binding protein
MLKTWGRFSGLFFLLLCLNACSKGIPPEGTIQVWSHAGQEAERQTLAQQVQRFNASQDEIAVQLTFIPEGTYNAQIQAASLSQDLPCLMEFDGPFVYNYIWQGKLIPLDNLLSEEIRQELLPSLIKQGTYRGRLYAVGTFDSGLGLYGRRSQLEAAGIRLPTSQEDAWTVKEFNRALAVLAQKDPDGQVLDLKLNYQGEWFTYGFSPLIQSAGSDLIERRNYRKARGTLNNRRAVAAMKQVQSWLKKGYVDPNLDDAAFTQGRVALAWGGHWNYRDYQQAAGGDLVILPLPDFGRGAKAGQGSWQWGITKTCPNPQGAARFLTFLLQAPEVLAMAEANGAVPGTKRAIAQSSLYAEGGPLRLFSAQLLAGSSLPRPQTPAYPVITSAFQNAFDDIRNGLSAKAALEQAAVTIDQDIKDNEGYREP